MKLRTIAAAIYLEILPSSLSSTSLLSLSRSTFPFDTYFSSGWVSKDSSLEPGDIQIYLDTELQTYPGNISILSLCPVSRTQNLDSAALNMTPSNEETKKKILDTSQRIQVGEGREEDYI